MRRTASQGSPRWMLETFGNHPSFVMFSLGNELWGSPERLGEILRHYKEKDSRHLYTQGCNNFQHFPLMVPEDDYFVGDGHDGFHYVFDHEDGDALFAQADDDFDHLSDLR